MRFITDPLLGLFCSVFGLLVHPFGALAMVYVGWEYNWPVFYAGTLPFILGVIAVCSSTKDEGLDAQGTQRGSLPAWAWIWETPDERAPGDTVGEPVPKMIYHYLGYLPCSLYWHIWRNRALGLAFKFGRVLPDGQYLNGELWGKQVLPNGAWRVCINLGIGQFSFGTQTTKLKKTGELYAIPWFTFKTNHNGKP